jgi:long-chain acyl-CoA synthetase
MDENGVTTLAKLYEHSVAKHGNKKSLGVRQVLSEEELVDKSTGKLMKKYELGDYSWKTFNQVNETVNALSRGFDVLNLKPKEKIAIFAETREEWFITAMVALVRNLPSKF